MLLREFVPLLSKNVSLQKQRFYCMIAAVNEAGQETASD